MLKERISHISWIKLLVVLLVLLAFLLNALDPDHRELPDNGEYASVTHEEYGFSIDYPTKWRVGTYGENGSPYYHYDSSIKLDLYITRRIPFSILIRYRPVVNPTLQNVSEWGNVVMSRILTRRNIEEFPDTVNGKPIIRHRYYWGSYVTEDVYIARSSDMIIISMEVKQRDYDDNIEDFNTIVESFRPFE